MLLSHITITETIFSDKRGINLALNDYKPAGPPILKYTGWAFLTYIALKLKYLFFSHFLSRACVATGLKIRRSLTRSSAQPIFSPRVENSRSDKIPFSLTAVHCFHGGGNTASSLERILCGELVRRIPEKA